MRLESLLGEAESRSAWIDRLDKNLLGAAFGGEPDKFLDLVRFICNAGKEGAKHPIRPKAEFMSLPKDVHAVRIR